jgi:glycosyltransferase involved in cell wall biosynthesis
MTPLRVALVSAFPPSTGPLSEYAWHLVNGLRANCRIEKLWVLSDVVDGASRTTEGRVEVMPCWRFDSPAYPITVLRAARRLPVDLLWFNLHMTATGNSRASWFAGLAAPAIARAAGFKVMVTLHNMLGITQLERAGFRARALDIAAAHAATGLVCRAHAICALRPEYVTILHRRHGARHACHVPIGAIGQLLTTPTPRRNGEVLAFGHFGTYKRLEPVIEAILALRRDGIQARLTVGGTDSRHAPGYLQRLRVRYEETGAIDFLGYVPEQDVPALFRRAEFCVLPYSTVTGMSSVAMQAATHGLPIVASDIPAFRAIAGEGLRMSFFRDQDAGSLAEVLARLLCARDDLESQRQANLVYAAAQPMEAIADRYLDIAEAAISDVRTAAFAARQSPI